ncbi:PREDICTED: alpha-ketoglutarate-dependent dioxygenase FTO [Nanorana parkeri]|uniref:alpha-ketoglutarate-dependent dioxygenase FTO n=1 Tax=Nanorana parkeri TaxID=125878 RepID=UPI0008545F1A|nr:PREDICTED: alpha-ketoglutarate-dependent dioxygenase FTO [Nanorana parkeri]
MFKGNTRRMKRYAKGDSEKEVKRQKLLEQIGDSKLPYVTPKDETFYQLWKTKYAKLAIHEAPETPAELHQNVQKAFLLLLQHGCLFQDLVRLKGKDVLTPVSRILIGQPGCTYRYLNTRLFAVPWPDDKHSIMYNTEELADACNAFSELNKFLYNQTRLKLQQYETDAQCSSVSPQQISLENDSETNQDEMHPYNVTLINYMNPHNMFYLKEEPYFGMGQMAVSWHHDENLLDESTVAVYSYSYQDCASEIFEDEKALSNWHVGLKIAWDIETPGLALPLNPGDSYFMLGDLNKTHQHCVIAGSQPRFSSTHRVAECSEGTLNYIKARCQTALNNLLVIPSTGEKELKSLEVDILQQAEKIHNEVEFEWLRQFWFQGKRYTKCSNFWIKAMTDLEDDWRQMETMSSLMLKGVVKQTWTQEVRCNIVNSIFPLLSERQDLRREWSERCRCKLAKSLPVDQRPQCYPYWEEDDPSMPMPFDLSKILSELEHLIKEMD